MLDKLEKKDFEPLLDETLEIDSGEATHEARIVDLRNLGREPEKGRHSFSVLLRVPKDALYDQQIFTVKSKSLGALDLFLVPVGPDEEGMLYEAIFA